MSRPKPRVRKDLDGRWYVIYRGQSSLPCSSQHEACCIAKWCNA